MMFRNRALTALAAAKLISTMGSWMTVVALPWFVLTTTGSPTKMGQVLGAEVLAVALLGIPSGSVVARLGVLRTMLVGDLLRAVIVALIPGLHAVGLLSFPLLLVLSFAIGVFSAPYYSSQRLILPELLGEDEQVISQGNSMIDGANRFGSLAGPALSGVLIGLLSAANVMWVDAATYLASFLLLALFVRRQTKRRPVPSAEPTGMAVGLRYVFGNRIIKHLGIALFLMGIALPMLMAALPVLTYLRYGADPKITGFLVTSYGAGMALGSVMAYMAFARYSRQFLGTVGMICVVIPLWVLISTPSPVVVGVALFVSGLFIPVNSSIIGTLVTLRTPEGIRPQVMTVVVTSENLAGPLAFALAGPLLQALGLATVFALVAAMWTGAALAFLVALRAAAQPPPPDHISTERATVS
ncbi:MFS transporter [Streptomyces sp. NPDC046805]|uniref:MFS transporter n=1 Tax=Streptomyces sp. NPDC046805 TaxID=3155134 RepID=UPI0033EF285D